MTTDKNQKIITGVIEYPAELHQLLTKYAATMRKITGQQRRPKISDIYFLLFKKAGGMEMLAADVEALKDQLANLPATPKARRGRPSKK